MRQTVRHESECPTDGTRSTIVVTVYGEAGRHCDLGAVRSAVSAALTRRFSGVEAIHVAVEPSPRSSSSSRGA